MEMVVEKLRTFQESCGLMMQSHYCNPHDPRMGGKCLSAGYRLDFFPGGGGAENIVKETGKLVVTGACGDRKLRTELHCIS